MFLTDRILGQPTEIGVTDVYCRVVDGRVDETPLTKRLNELHARGRTRRLLSVVPAGGIVDQDQRYLIYYESFKDIVPHE